MITAAQPATSQGRCGHQVAQSAEPEYRWLMARDDEVYRITNARPSASVDRNFRTKRYLLSMGIRTACFLAAVAICAWAAWLSLIFLVAAVILPYFSVVMANNATRDRALELMPPLIIKDTAELPRRHPDRTAS